MPLRLLGVSANLLADIAHNTRLVSAPAVPVADLYTGVLYAALDLPSMDSATRRRANRWLVVVSALFGALRPADKVPPYRLSMGVNLSGLGPLASVWRAPLAAVLPAAAGRGVIVDCRSSTYAAAWVPQGDLAARWVQIRVPGATHMAKHTRGLVARHLCESGVDARTARALQDVVSQRFETTLTKPSPPRPALDPRHRFATRLAATPSTVGAVRAGDCDAVYAPTVTRRSAEGALEVLDQVADVLEADGDAQDAVRDARQRAGPLAPDAGAWSWPGG